LAKSVKSSRVGVSNAPQFDGMRNLPPPKGEGGDWEPRGHQQGGLLTHFPTRTRIAPTTRIRLQQAGGPHQLDELRAIAALIAALARPGQCLDRVPADGRAVMGPPELLSESRNGRRKAHVVAD